MDGNTWQRYRFITERGTRPLFFLEPDNPDDWPRHFTDNGFTVLAHYFSNESTDLTHRPKGFLDTVQRLESEGVTIRQLNLERFEEELRAIHELSLLCFRDNFLYTPIRREDFLAQYLVVRAYVRPELVLIAEQHGQPIGYVFGLPDLLQRNGPGRLIDTVIIKTLAVHPDHAGRGLGGLLTVRCHEAARAIGFTKTIYALMHEANHSRRLGGAGAEMMRRYALFARPLRGRP
jgi:predicted N-acetyltransferase YhbS